MLSGTNKRSSINLRVNSCSPNECNSFEDVKVNTSSNTQVAAYQDSPKEDGSSTVTLFNDDVVSHSHGGDSLKKRKGQPAKPYLPIDESVEDIAGTKIRSSSVTKKATASLDQTDIHLNAVSLATEIGFKNPQEKIIIKSSRNDREEEINKQICPLEVVQQLIDYRNMCKCSCLTDLSMKDLASHRMEVTLLDRHSRDFFIMGLLRCGAVTIKETWRHTDRIRNRFTYRIMNTRICQCCFLAVNNIGGKYLKNLKKHFARHGVTSRLHGNLGRKPYHAISSTDITDVTDFVSRYASSFGILVARRSKKSKGKHVLQLPATDNVTSVHKKYKDFFEQSGKRAVALTSFRKIWNRHLPHIKLTVKDSSISLAKTVPLRKDQQEAKPNTDSNGGDLVLKQMSQLTGSKQTTDSVTSSSGIQITVAQKIPVSLPYEHNSSEVAHNHMPMNIYLNEGDSQVSLQDPYIYSQTSLPVNHNPQTATCSSNNSPPSVHMKDIKTSASLTSSIDAHYPPMPVAVNSPVKHMTVAQIHDPKANRHFLLLNANSDVDANSGQPHMSQFDHKTSACYSC